MKAHSSIAAILSLLTLYFVILPASQASAQLMRWTLVGDSVGRAGYYGVKGVWGSENQPGAREESAGWIDDEDNLWLFGGWGLDGYWNYNRLNDLWVFSPEKNQWAWIHGFKNGGVNGQYGQKGVFSEFNTPGARSKSMTWKDSDGNFWLFGGDGGDWMNQSGLLNDLWVFSTEKRQWVWIHGEKTANPVARRGTKGVADPANTPGGRSDATTWVDKNGNFWLFGGIGKNASGAGGEFSDLWTYNTSTNSWTWVKGDSIPNLNGVYGIRGAAGSTNNPSARSGASGWTDAEGHLWLLSGGRGGYVFDDIWKYNLTTGNWTWVRGTGEFYDPPTYNPTTTFKGEDGVLWLDKEGKVWFFGGMLEHSFKVQCSGQLSTYDQVTDTWTSIGYFYLDPWKGSSDSTAGPGYRASSVGWMDSLGNLWLSGGYGETWIEDQSGNLYSDNWGLAGDLWKFTLCMPPGAPTNATAQNALSICKGASTTLSASGSGELNWYDKAAGGSIIASGAIFQTPALNSTTTYYVEAVTCTPSATRLAITVTVNPLPTVSAGADKEVCLEESVTLSGSGATSYSWDKGVTNGTAFKPPLGATVYTVTGTDTKGCRNTDQVSVTVNPLPAVSAGSDKQVCAGETVVLKGSGASGYSWDKGVSDNVAFTLPAGTTVYTVTGTDAKGCKGTDQVTVVVNALPSVSAGPDKEVCAGEKVTLAGSGASTYSWDKGVANGTPFTPPAGTTIYTVTGTDAKGCKNSDQVSVKVNLLPNVYAGEDKDICQGGKVNLAGSGANAYSWDKGVNNGVAFAPPLGSTVYTVTGTDARGCKNTDQVSVTVHPLPSISAGADKVICEGVPLSLTGSGGASYTWNKGVLNGIPFSPPVGITEYSVTGVDAHGCSGTALVQVTVIPSPDVTLTLPAIDDFCNLENSIPLSGGLPAGGVYSGQGVSAGYFHPKTSGVGTHQISYTYTSGNGCSSTATAMMEVQLCIGGIEKDAEATAFSIFPNPGRGHYTLVLPGEGTVMIFNATGKVVMEKSGVSDLLELYLLNLSDGVYLLKFIQDSKVSSLKFIQKN